MDEDYFLDAEKYWGFDDKPEFTLGVKYRHKGNNHIYYYQPNGMWRPVEGRGLGNTDRNLNSHQMEVYDGTVAQVIESRKGFKVGQIVKLKTGERPIEITSLSHSGSNLWGTYVDSQYKIVGRHVGDFEYYNQTQTGEDTMTKLYEVKESDTATTFATKLAVNSSGLWVMEEKGTGRVFTATPSSAEEVMPYTISVQFFGMGNALKDYSYFAAKGAFEVNQVFMMDSNSICRVTGVDTKSIYATKDFEPVVQFEVKAV